MTDKTVRLWDRKTLKELDILYHDNGDGTYSPIMANSSIIPDLDFTQVITITTAGTPVQGPDKSNPNGWHIKASPLNTVVVYFMFHGQTLANKGFPLNPGQLMTVNIENLSSLDFDAGSGGNGSKLMAVKI